MSNAELIIEPLKLSGNIIAPRAGSDNLGIQPTAPRWQWRERDCYDADCRNSHPENRAKRMLGKILRKHREQERREARQSSKAAPPPEKVAEPLNDFRFAAYLFLVLMIGSGTYLYYVRWEDDNSLITVILHRDGEQSPVTYQVLKSELGDRAFTTIDGVRVTVASSERMEVIGL